MANTLEEEWPEHSQHVKFMSFEPQYVRDLGIKMHQIEIHTQMCGHSAPWKNNKQ